MPPKFSYPSKISRPVVTHISPRPRLYAMLDAERTKPIIWLSAPGGFGKTILTSSYIETRNIPSLWYQIDKGDSDLPSFFYYLGLMEKKASPELQIPTQILTPEYLPGVHIFSRRFFEQLCSRLPTPQFLVFDNYQDIPLNDAFHEVFKEGLFSIPVGINVIILSRTKPPSVFAGLLAQNKIGVIDTEDIRLDQDETADILQLQYGTKIDKKTAGKIHLRTQGWAAGITLMAKSLEKENFNSNLVGNYTPEEIFEYFAEEIIKHLDKKKQDFLFKSAILPRMTLHLVEKLTGNRDASHILSDLNGQNLFLEKRLRPVLNYQYHPLFREFLLRYTQRVFSQEVFIALQNNAAELLEEDGFIEEAAAIYSATDNVKKLQPLILGYAKKLLSQGRNQLLEKWIRTIPSNLREKDPWLLYWLGAAQLAFNPAESRCNMEKAFALFRARKMKTGVFLAWSGIIYAIKMENDVCTLFDPWFQVLEKLLEEFAPYPEDETGNVTAISMLVALIMHRPDHPNFEFWKNRALALSEKNDNWDLKSTPLYDLAIYHAYRGDFENAQQIIAQLNERNKSGKITPLASIMTKLVTATVLGFTGHFEQSVDAVKQGLQIARETGIPVLDYMLLGQAVLTSLAKGDADMAEKFFTNMEASRNRVGKFNQAFYYYLSARKAMLRQDYLFATTQIKTALDCGEKGGVMFSLIIIYILKSLLSHLMGKQQNAEEYLSLVREIGQNIVSPYIEFHCDLLEAFYSFACNNNTVALPLLQKAMRIGKENRFFNAYFLATPDIFARMCTHALRHEISVAYVQDIIRQRNFLPTDEARFLENWPWSIKIVALGKFEVQINGKPLQFTGKTPKKPLLLLKILIALGIKGGTKGYICDQLWPEADGDFSSKAFSVTLTRLRKLLGLKEAIVFSEDWVSLNAEYCWVDYYSVANLLPQIESAVQKDNMAMAAVILQHALNLYKGELFSTNNEPWALSCRKKLHNNFLPPLKKISTFFEKTHAYLQAIACYNKALEIDPSNENWTQRLLHCQHQLAQNPDFSE